MRWLIILTGTALVVYLLLILSNLPFWTSPYLWEEGDLAANGLQVERARKGLELLGPYSRHGFHHPGPFTFYAQALLEPAFSIFPTYLARHLAAQLALTLAAFTWVMWLLSRAGLPPPLAVAGLFLAPAPLIFLSGGTMFMLASVWGPLVVVAPMVLFVVAAARILDGDPVALPAAAVGATISYHTHLLTIPVLLVVGAFAIAGLVRGRHRFTPALNSGQGRLLVASGALVMVAGLVPVIADELTGRPGNLTMILHFMGDHRPTIHSWSEVVTKLGQAFTDPLVVLFPAARELLGGPMVTLGAALFLFLVSMRQFHRGDRPWRFVVLLTWLTVAVTVCVARGVTGELYTYLFYYLYGMAGLLYVFVGREIYDRWLRGRLRNDARASLLAAACGLILLAPWMLTHRIAAPPARDIFEEIVTHFELDDATPVHLSIGNGNGDGDLWNMLPTYALRLRRAGTPVTVDEPFVYICGYEMRAKRGAPLPLTLLFSRRPPAPGMTNHIAVDDWGVFLLRAGDGRPHEFQQRLSE